MKPEDLEVIRCPATAWRSAKALRHVADRPNASGLRRSLCGMAGSRIAPRDLAPVDDCKRCLALARKRGIVTAQQSLADVEVLA